MGQTRVFLSPQDIFNQLIDPWSKRVYLLTRTAQKRLDEHSVLTGSTSPGSIRHSNADDGKCLSCPSFLFPFGYVDGPRTRSCWVMTEK